MSASTVKNGRGKTSSVAKPQRTTFEHIPASEIAFDPLVQRDLIPARVKALVANFNLDAVGVLTVSRRSASEVVNLDGQHRRAALVELGLGELAVPCHVYHGLSLPEEASMFRLLNDTRRATAMDDYLKGVIAGESECIAINECVESHGFYVSSDGNADKAIACVNAMRKVYRQRKSGMDGPRALDLSLGTIVAAWGHRPDATDGQIVQGLGEVFLRFGDEVDRQALVTKLAKAKGGPSGIIGNARTLRDMQKGSIAGNVAQIVVGLYNNGRRSNRLGE